MSFLDFVSNSPIFCFLVVFVICLTIESVFKSYTKTAVVRKHGYPPADCDAEGDPKSKGY